MPKSQGAKESLGAYLRKAQERYDEFEYDRCLTICQKIFKSNPNQLKALDLAAKSLMELNREQEAKELLLKLSELEPSSKEAYLRYFSIAQMSEGRDAVKYYTKGIDFLKNKLDQGEPTSYKEKEEMERHLCEGYVALANLYLEGLQDEDNALTEAKKYIDLCLALNPTNDNMAITYGHYLLVSEKPEEAKSVLLASVSRWFPVLKDYIRSIEAEDAEYPEEIPTFEEVFNAAKYLVELRVYKEAWDILSCLMNLENADHMLEILYVLGNLHYLQGQDEQFSEEERNGHFHSAQEYFHEVISQAGKGPHEEEYLCNAEELLIELNNKLGALSPDDEEETDDDLGSSDLETDEDEEDDDDLGED